MLVVDFGAQYAQLIARRVREAHVYSEIVPHEMPVPEILAKHPAAIILSGGPASIYEEGAPGIDRALLDSGVAVLGVCYGFQVMAQALGGRVEHSDIAEFGRTDVEVLAAGSLFAGQPSKQVVWMSHRDVVVGAPPGCRATASSAAARHRLRES